MISFCRSVEKLQSITTRKTVIECAISAAVHLEPLRDRISTTVQNLIVADKCSTYQQRLLIVPSSTTVLNQKHFNPNYKTISSGSGLKPLLIFFKPINISLPRVVSLFISKLSKSPPLSLYSVALYSSGFLRRC
jgi:hypothetical protein